VITQFIQIKFGDATMKQTTVSGKIMNRKAKYNTWCKITEKRQRIKRLAGISHVKMLLALDVFGDCLVLSGTDVASVMAAHCIYSRKILSRV
jgi:hypothetical protein